MHNWKNSLIAGVATSVLVGLSAAPAAAQNDDPAVKPISEHGGSINPFTGSVNPFSGSLNPFYGTINPFWGDTTPYWGSIDPFAGSINPFAGSINPFWGSIDPFWGSIDPFAGSINPFGDLDAYWGSIDAFWGSIGPFWGSIDPFWGSLDPFSEATAADYAELQTQLQDLVAQSEAVFGPAVEAQTGQSFEAAFADAMFAEYGINLDDPSSFEGVSAAERGEFFLNWYDGLMTYSGLDHVDHWMPMVNWTPALTQDQGMGTDSLIGLLDMSANPGEIIHYSNEGGYNFVGGGHGSAVASLMVAPHDGTGVMGIAPDASVMQYNPFDSTGSASWDDVTVGVQTLVGAGARVINMSLGEPGWTLHENWGLVFDAPGVAERLDDVVFVKAAGNAGVTQTGLVEWSAEAMNASLIVVGAVNANGDISSFSNRPGDACITATAACAAEEDMLKYRFLVAPGELILTSDGAGGVARRSGTSFAAPLVAGAVSLLHDRWPWLQGYAPESADILFQTARDLGDPGVDSTYGWGLLDVTASQSPIDFNNVVFITEEDLASAGVLYATGSGEGSVLDSFAAASTSASDFRNTILQTGMLDLWQLEGASIVAFEEVGRTFRDFAVPLSTLLYDQAGDFGGSNEQYQRHVYDRMIDWANGNAFAAIQTETAETDLGGLSLTLTATPRHPSTLGIGERRSFSPGAVLKDEESGLEVRFGEGFGAAALSSTDGFAYYNELQTETSGVNPLLSLASGGMYFGAGMQALPWANVSVGFTQKSDDHNVANPVTGEEFDYLGAVSDYEAQALTLDVAFTLSPKLELNTSYTRLSEATGLLGAQGAGALSLEGGAVSNAMTVGASYALTPDFKLSGTATVSRTAQTEFGDSTLALTDSGLTSTALAIAADSANVFADGDRMRFSLAQPLHVENGALSYSSVQVVDRSTGQLGLVSENWDLSGAGRRLVAQAQYAIPVFEDRAEVSFYGLTDFSTEFERENLEHAFGTRIAFKY